jgi:hypothetical protein
LNTGGRVDSLGRSGARAAQFRNPRRRRVGYRPPVPPSPDARLLELVGEAQGLLELSELREGLIMALDRLVPSDSVSINEIGPDPARVHAVVRPALPAGLHETFARLAHENPLIGRFGRTADTRPYRFSDVVSVEELHALALYREFYGAIGLEHQIAFVVKVSSEAMWVSR